MVCLVWCIASCGNVVGHIVVRVCAKMVVGLVLLRVIYLNYFAIVVFRFSFCIIDAGLYVRIT